MSGHKLQRFMFRLGTKRTLHEIPTSVWWSDSEDDELAFKKLDRALDLIAQYAPEKYRSLRRDIDSILVAWLPAALGRYCHELRMVELCSENVINPETTPHSLASTLVHEAQHARLYRFGFGYEEPIQARIERLCYGAEKNFARKIPGCDALVARAEAWMAADLEPVASNERRLRARVDQLKELGCPDWVIKFGVWIRRPRAR